VRWVIAYDIGLDKARRRVARRLERVGFRRQKSVFEGDASPSEIARLLDEMAESLLSEGDVITAWPATENGTARLEHRGAPRADVRKDWIIL
jgi:CRISPR-associated endonuclease Cas2